MSNSEKARILEVAEELFAEQGLERFDSTDYRGRESEPGSREETILAK